MILETIPAIGKLTSDQKLRLVWELWRDVDKDAMLDAGTARILDERLADHDANPDAVRSTAEVTSGIMALKQRLAAEAI
jgi:hypothetical protein